MQKLEDALRSCAAQTERTLAEYLAPSWSGDTRLAEAMRYATLGGGKRIRAFLTLSFCRLFGGEDEAALPFAAAIEMVHAYSLVHDDMPCMDNDDMRRGKPSCHRAFGEANALLAGDTLLTQAFEVAASNREVSDAAVRRAVAALAHGAGALGMAGGQFYDLDEHCESYEALRRLQDMKTGALIRTAALLGCYAAPTLPGDAALGDVCAYADGIGFAFQIVDDLLDVRGDAARLGKPTGSDAKNGKKTILTFRSPAEAQALAEECTRRAEAAIAPYPGSETLVSLAEYLLTRDH